MNPFSSRHCFWHSCACERGVGGTEAEGTSLAPHGTALWAATQRACTCLAVPPQLLQALGLRVTGVSEWQTRVCTHPRRLVPSAGWQPPWARTGLLCPPWRVCAECSGERVVRCHAVSSCCPDLCFLRKQHGACPASTALGVGISVRTAGESYTGEWRWLDGMIKLFSVKARPLARMATQPPRARVQTPPTLLCREQAAQVAPRNPTSAPKVA